MGVRQTTSVVALIFLSPRLPCKADARCGPSTFGHEHAREKLIFGLGAVSEVSPDLLLVCVPSPSPKFARCGAAPWT
jgi:hypothetical protein